MSCAVFRRFGASAGMQFTVIFFDREWAKTVTGTTRKCAVNLVKKIIVYVLRTNV